MCCRHWKLKLLRPKIQEATKHSGLQSYSRRDAVGTLLDTPNTPTQTLARVAEGSEWDKRTSKIRTVFKK